MTLKSGDRAPNLILSLVGQEGVEKMDATTFFAGRKVVLFAVPGAFTPTCSARHLPGYKDHAADFAAKGVAAVVCTSVNDSHVMRAWAKDQGITNEIVMLADGNGEWAEAMGLNFDGSAFGMGERSQRYAAILDDGLIIGLFIEAPGEFKVSSAEYVLSQL